MMRWISITAIGSMPANGSSSRMKRGWVASARAISTRRRSPPDSAGRRRVAQMLHAQVLQQAGQARSISALSSGLPALSCCSSSTARTFSETLSLRKIDASCGK
jgi:hypothetical protein